MQSCRRRSPSYPAPAAANTGANTFHRILADTTVPDWRLVMEMNLKGAFLFIRHALLLLRKAGKGQIINISSDAGLAPGTPSAVAYSVSKQTMRSLTGSVHLEERPHGIRACTIAPGETAILNLAICITDRLGRQFRPIAGLP